MNWLPFFALFFVVPILLDLLFEAVEKIMFKVFTLSPSELEKTLNTTGTKLSDLLALHSGELLVVVEVADEPGPKKGPPTP